jgi:hypothetical protein
MAACYGTDASPVKLGQLDGRALHLTPPTARSRPGGDLESARDAFEGAGNALVSGGAGHQ